MKKYIELVPEANRAKIENIFEEVVQKGEPVHRGEVEDLCVIDDEGKEVPVELNASVLEWGGREVIQALLQDVTKRKKAEEKAENLRSLLKSLQRLDHLISRESDFQELLEKATAALLETQGYLDVSIASRDEDGVLHLVTHNGNHERRNWKVNHKKGEDGPLVSRKS